MLLRFLPPRPGGEIDATNALIAAAGGLLVIATSIWMVYNLEILKARHLQGLRRRRAAGLDLPAVAAEEEHEEPLERALTAQR